LFVGVDVGREKDFTVITVVEQVENLFKVRAMLELEGMRLPAQLERLKPVLSAPHFRKAKFDQTGLGIGLLEFAQENMGAARDAKG
jgi:phage FluMu gp28-like protein